MSNSQVQKLSAIHFASFAAAFLFVGMLIVIPFSAGKIGGIIASLFFSNALYFALRSITCAIEDK